MNGNYKNYSLRLNYNLSYKDAKPIYNNKKLRENFILEIVKNTSTFIKCLCTCWSYIHLLRKAFLFRRLTVSRSPVILSRE